MAANVRRGIKRKRGKDHAKLLLDDKVEVRSVEEGFLGSWHLGTVIVCKHLVRQIKYDNLLSDEGKIMIDHIQVSPAIDGEVIPAKTAKMLNDSRNYIRPPPPPVEVNRLSLGYGQCVDLLHADAWWEGVIVDHNDGSDERAVFFPDMGDELNAKMDNLRITQDWDEVNGEWDPRGNWIFLDLIEEIKREYPVFVSYKQIWYDVRLKKGFENLKDWMYSNSDAWKELILNVVLDYFKLTALEFARKMNPKLDISSIELADLNLDDILYPKLHSNDPSEVTPRHDPDHTSDMNHDEVLKSSVLSAVAAPSNLSPSMIGSHISNENSLDTSPTNHEEVVKSPALPVIVPPSNPDELPAIKPHEKFNDSSRKNRKKRRSRLNWVPADPAFEAEYCPDIIQEYLQTPPKARPPASLVMKIKKHIFYLGWRREHTVVDGNKRARYTKGDDSKAYHSLHMLCKHLSQQESQQGNCQVAEKEQPINQHESQPVKCQVAQRQQPSITDNINIVIEPEYCPQAIVDYILWRKGERREDVSLIALKVKVRKHLCAVGWSIFNYSEWSRKEMQYRSPSDKIYKNLLGASRRCLRDQESGKSTSKVEVRTALAEFSEVKMEGISKQRQKRKKNESSSNALVEVMDDPDSTELTRTGKRVRQTATQSTPKTVLCWLIEKNVILPRAKVFYRSIKTSGEGKVTRDGIKCNCCQELFTIRGFELHLGSTCNKPSGNLFLEDGKSLLQCQLQLKRESCKKIMKVKSCSRKQRSEQRNDHVCSACHFGGELVLCDQCPSSFHTGCLGLKEVPEGDWFCPSCRCRICSIRITEENALSCYQCENQYHRVCASRIEKGNLNRHLNGNWFCNKRCEQIYMALSKLLRKPIQLEVENLTWTLLKYEPFDNIDQNSSNVEDLMENYVKLRVALDVMHECFEPVQEPRTKTDLVEDVVFGRRSELSRLNFQGFFTIILEKNDEIITAANLRIYGKKVAEVPLVATRFQYRRLGMCRILMNQLEKTLAELGVERLVLPAVPSVLDTWTKSFGFSRMTESDRSKFLGYTFLDFQGTSMCQKLLRKPSSPTKSSLFRLCAESLEKDSGEINMMMAFDNSIVSDVFQPDTVEENGMLDHRAMDIVQVDDIAYCASTPHVFAMDEEMNLDPPQSQSETTIESSIEPAPHDFHKDGENSNNGGSMKCYKRKRISAC